MSTPNRPARVDGGPSFGSPTLPDSIQPKGLVMSSVLWFQGGACSGNTMSFLNAEEPNVVDLITDFGLDLLWHPSLGLELGENAQRLFRDCASGAKPLDIFVFEGTVIEGPD